MLTTSADDWLMYFTSEEKPPASGLFSPEPKSPSTTRVAEFRRVKLHRDFGEALHAFTIHYALAVCLAVIRETIADIKEKSLDIVTLFGEHPCNGKGIASVIAGTGKNHYFVALTPSFGNGLRYGFCGSFHQFDRTNRLMFYRKLVQFAYLSARKYLHIKGKFTVNHT